MGKISGSILSAALGAGLASGAAFSYHKQKNREEESIARKGSAPLKPEKEMVMRMPDFIDYDHFRLAVQPVIDLQTGDIVGGEVLSRLHHPEQGVIFPDKFLPAVEAAGIYPGFDHYIFRKSCELMQRLRARGAAIQYLSCNFSRLTLSENEAATRLAKIADAFALPHECMAVEITEREQEKDNDQFCENLVEIKKAGFRIFVDDLGAGVTSVRDLWSYPVDVVKIDRSLLLATDDEQGRSAYRGLRNLVVDLGCEVLSEGVETQEQHRFVLDAGCHYGQGFLFYRPMEAEQFCRLMGTKD